MRPRSEEEPEPEEDPAEAPASTATSAPAVPSVGPEGRDYEYRTELLTAAEILDGSTLAERLTTASSGGWDLVDIVPAGDRHAVLLRRVRQQKRGSRPVGFAPPGG